jgi:hypothetical protein
MYALLLAGLLVSSSPSRAWKTECDCRGDECALLGPVGDFPPWVEAEIAFDGRTLLRLRRSLFPTETPEAAVDIVVRERMATVDLPSREQLKLPPLQRFSARELSLPELEPAEDFLTTGVVCALGAAKRPTIRGGWLGLRTILWDVLHRSADDVR